jgi:hypothetical protein
MALRGAFESSRHVLAVLSLAVSCGTGPAPAGPVSAASGGSAGATAGVAGGGSAGAPTTTTAGSGGSGGAVAVAGAGSGGLAGGPQVPTLKRPNIVLVLADDMGYSDIGAFGGEIETPNLDQLAQGGLRYTRFYNNGRCCPTRASLLTGLYPHQAGLGHMVADGDQTAQNGPGYAGEISERTVTLAEALKRAGYATYMSGKWHVASNEGAEAYNLPNQRGFERFFGIYNGAANYFTGKRAGLSSAGDGQHHHPGTARLLHDQEHRRRGGGIHRGPRRPRAAVLPVPGVHGTSLGAARAGRGRRQVSR